MFSYMVVCTRSTMYLCTVYLGSYLIYLWATKEGRTSLYMHQPYLPRIAELVYFGLFE